MFRPPAAVSPLVALLYTIALPAGSLTAQSATPRYTIGWWDVAATAAGAATAGIAVLSRPPAARCAPCDSLDLPSYERIGIRSNASAARTASTVLVLGVVGGAALASLSGTSPARARGDFAVLADAGSWTVAVTEVLKVAVHRARPAVYRADGSAAAADPDNRESFPSSHTSVAFAAATAYATLAARQHLPHATRNSIILYVASTAVGVLRVAGGKHFPTDVLAGAALGTGVGWATARLHPMTP